jgi:hypothetical protein
MPRGVRTGMVDQQLLEAALEGLELQRQRLDEQIRQVRERVGRGPAGRPGRAASKPAASSTQGAPTKRRTLSAAARRRIAAAQKKRWANYRKNEKNQSK